MSLVENKVLIITGCSSGIGLATATMALDGGAKVFGVDISASPASLDGRANWSFVQINLTDAPAAATVAENCIAQYGRIDGLLNVAGVMDNMASADAVTDDIWDRCISVNLTAPVKLMRAVLPFMRTQQSGSIVNVASKAAISGAVAGIAYTASKHGLVGATKNVAFRFKDDNIRCNAILPGGVATNIIASIDMSKFDMDAAAKMKPILDAHKRSDGSDTAQPNDIAPLLLFLASDASSTISGALIPIDRAWSTI